MFNIPLGFASRGFGGNILDALVAQYSFDETDGTAVDAHIGGYNLTNGGTGTLNRDTGIIGNAYTDVIAGTNRWPKSSDPIFRFSGDFYIACAVYNDVSVAGDKPVIARWNTSSTAKVWRIYKYALGTQSMRFEVSSDGTATTEVASGTVADGVWVFVEAFKNSTLIGCCATPLTNPEPLAWSTVSYSSGLKSDTVDLTVARYANAASTLSGRLDQLWIYDEVPGDDKRAALFNEGNLLAYPT